MHATKQPYISAKLFRKRLLQYCWKGKKEKASVNERMNAKYHYTSKTKINSDRRKNVKFGNSLLCHWRDTLRLLCSWSSESSGLRLSSLDYQQSQHFLLKWKTIKMCLISFAFLCLTGGNRQFSLLWNFYFQVPYYALVFVFVFNWGIMASLAPKWPNNVPFASQAAWSEKQ